MRSATPVLLVLHAVAVPFFELKMGTGDPQTCLSFLRNAFIPMLVRVQKAQKPKTQNLKLTETNRVPRVTKESFAMHVVHRGED